MREPVAVYFGTYTECVFLTSALEGSGISVSMRNHSVGGEVPDEDVRIFVDRADVERAMPLIQHFIANGTRSRSS